MTDEQTSHQTDKPQPATGEAWREVGKQFEALGQSLATAFRTAWEDENNRRHVKEMQTGLESMVNAIGKALEETAAKPEAQKARVEIEKAARSVHAAGQQTWQETKPHLVSTLRQLSAELQKTITNLEQEQTTQTTAEGTPDKPSAD